MKGCCAYQWRQLGRSSGGEASPGEHELHRVRLAPGCSWRKHSWENMLVPWHLLHSKPAKALSNIGQNEGRGSALTPRVPTDLKLARGRSALQ